MKKMTPSRLRMGALLERAVKLVPVAGELVASPCRCARGACFGAGLRYPVPHVQHCTVCAAEYT